MKLTVAVTDTRTVSITITAVVDVTPIFMVLLLSLFCCLGYFDCCGVVAVIAICIHFREALENITSC